MKGDVLAALLIVALMLLILWLWYAWSASACDTYGGHMEIVANGVYCVIPEER